MFLYLHNKTFWLRHEDIFFQVSIQESCFYIHLVDFPPILCCHGEQSVDGIPFCCGGECFFIVNFLFLCIAFCHKPCFVFVKWAISFVFVLVYPLTTNWFASKWWFHQLPCPFIDERTILFTHNFFPLNIWRKLFK